MNKVIIEGDVLVAPIAFDDNVNLVLSNGISLGYSVYVKYNNPHKETPQRLS